MAETHQGFQAHYKYKYKSTKIYYKIKKKYICPNFYSNISIDNVKIF